MSFFTQKEKKSAQNLKFSIKKIKNRPTCFDLKKKPRPPTSQIFKTHKTFFCTTIPFAYIYIHLYLRYISYYYEEILREKKVPHRHPHPNPHQNKTRLGPWEIL